MPIRMHTFSFDMVVADAKVINASIWYYALSPLYYQPMLLPLMIKDYALPAVSHHDHEAATYGLTEAPAPQQRLGSLIVRGRRRYEEAGGHLTLRY